ncbi:MAG: hypothetical protein ABI680_18110, partial [Chthoniobacteraceae bacterium]
MKCIFASLALATLVTAGHAAEKRNAELLEKATVFPLALDDAIEFRKTKTFLNDPKLWKPTYDRMIRFERERVNFGAVTQYDRRQRWGNYYTFMWRTKRRADLTVRFEFRQQNLGSHVQAKELHYPAAKGSLKSEFNVIGDDYEQDGQVTSWRAIIIEDGRIRSEGPSQYRH